MNRHEALNQVLQEVLHDRHLILSIADQLPPGVSMYFMHNNIAQARQRRPFRKKRRPIIFVAFRLTDSSSLISKTDRLSLLGTLQG
jgi:hypothetical protein